MVHSTRERSGPHPLHHCNHRAPVAGPTEVTLAFGDEECAPTLMAYFNGDDAKDLCSDCDEVYHGTHLRHA